MGGSAENSVTTSTRPTDNYFVDPFPTVLLVEPLNNRHIGGRDLVLYWDVVPISEVN